MIHAPGIYENLPEAEYLADESLGSSSLKRLLISPLTYWVHSPHNPDRPEDEGTDATDYGTAMHVRLLLGREAFYDRYASCLDPEQFPEHLKSGDELAARCSALGLPKSGTLRERSQRIRQADPDALLWTDVVDEHAERIGDREQIPARWIANIELAALAVEQDRWTRDLLTGGNAEVSLFWRDADTGAPLKARLDYLKGARIIDLKTYANQRGFPVEQAVAMALASHGYGMQAVSYSDGLRTLHEPPLFSFLFVGSGPVPNVSVRMFCESIDGDRTAYWAKAHREFRYAVGLWRHCMDRFGPNSPWITPASETPFLDEDFPLWAL